MKNTFNKENAPYWLGAIILLYIICHTLLYFSETQIPTVFTSSGLVAIISAIIGVLLTVFVTSILLKQQTKSEGEKDRAMKVFEKKQEIYHNFLEKFKSIIQDGEIKIGVKNAEGKIDRTIDELKDLIFQLSYLQMHTSEENIKKILSYIAEIIQILNDFNSTKDEKKQKESANFYSGLSEKLFDIVAILKNDLYGSECKTIPQSYMNEILEKCDLFVEIIEFNKHDIQIHFWTELANQLRNKGYKTGNTDDITQMVNEYYAKTKGAGISIELEKGIELSITCERRAFFYGISREKANDVDDANIEQRMKNISKLFKPNKWWYAWKYPDKYKLDFVDCDSPEFEELKNPRQRDKFIKDLADEIDRYVKKFRETKL